MTTAGAAASTSGAIPKRSPLSQPANRVLGVWSIFDAGEKPIGQSAEDGPSRKSEIGSLGRGAAVCSRHWLKRGSLVKPATVKSFGMSRGRVGRRTQRETSVAESNQLGDATSVCGPTQIYRRALPAQNNLFFRLYISVKVRSIFGATASVGTRRISRASSTATA